MHRASVERLRALKPEDLDRAMPFMGGTTMTIRDLLWYAMLHHAIHHRGQLSTYLRPMGEKVPSIDGESYDAAEARKAKQQNA